MNVSQLSTMRVSLTGTPVVATKHAKVAPRKSVSARASASRVNAVATTTERDVKIAEAFEMMSMRGSEEMARDELVTALRNTALSEAGIVEILATMDEDRSGFVDKDEFKHFFDNIPDSSAREWSTSIGMSEDKVQAYMGVLNAVFPGSASQTDFVAAMTNVLGKRDFNRDNSIQMISLCRDEITRDLVEELDSLWGQSFNISSLAGMIFCGCTSFRAAMSHAPDRPTGQSQKFVFTVAPHVAVDEDGNIGAVQRIGISNASSACGALIAFNNEALSGQCNFFVDNTDTEMSLLRQSLASHMNLASMSSVDLVDVTKAAREVIQEQLEKTLAIVIPPGSEKDYAVCTGIQIHGPENQGFFQCFDMYDVTDGKKTDLMPAYRKTLEYRQSKMGSFLWAQDEISAYGTENLLNSGKDAIAAKDLGRFQFLVEKGLPLCAKDSSGSSLMHLACAAGALSIVKYLVLKESSLKDSVDNDGATPLQIAIESDKDDIVEFLVSIGCMYITYRAKK